jgi:hypothetical protein
MSLLAVGFGFSTGVLNPFTVGVAQKLVGLPMFSGVWMRLVTFVLIYGLLIAFLIPYAKKIEKNPAKSIIYDPAMSERWASLRTDYTENKRKDRALIWFAIVLGIGIALILVSSVVPFLQDILMPLIALIFLVAGTISSLVSGMSLRCYFQSFGKGMLDILPAVLLILMANSIRYTMGGVQDSRHHSLSNRAAHAKSAKRHCCSHDLRACANLGAVYFQRFGKGVFAHAFDRTDCGSFWHFPPDCRACLRLWRRVFQCVLSDQSGASDLAWYRRHRVRQVVSVERKDSRSRTCANLRTTAVCKRDRILIELKIGIDFEIESFWDNWE